jgi:GT2 family glycosyltransferase
VLSSRRAQGPAIGVDCPVTTDVSEALAKSAVSGVFVMGMFESGLDDVGAALSRLGLTAIDRQSGVLLAEFNDRLLEMAGGTQWDLPAAAPREVARRLAPHRDEARRLFDKVVGIDGSPDGGQWVWADPRLSILAAFWRDALEVSPLAVLVHDHPNRLMPFAPDSVAAQRSGPSAAHDVVAQWDRYNRAAMVQCFEWPSAVLGIDTLFQKPKEQLGLMSELLEECGVVVPAGGVDDAIAGLEETASKRRSVAGSAVVPAEFWVLDRILGKMDGVHRDPIGWQDHRDLLDDVSDFYDEEYYGEGYDKSGVPYRRDEKIWVDFFSGIARSIVAGLGPRTVLDVGCATGILVESLHDLGVDARGIDVSDWAISQVPDEMRRYFAVGSMTDEIDGHFDLITCFEVIEHLPAFMADISIANLCRHADAVLFASTPDDFAETTHLNVETSGYWAQIFLEHGFLRDVDFDASFLAPHAVLFRRRVVDPDELVVEYERGIANVTSILGARAEEAVAEHDRLAARHNEMARSHDDQVAALQTKLTELERRRGAEILAAHEIMVRFERDEQRLSLLNGLLETELAATRLTKTFRYTEGLRRLYGRLKRVPPRPGLSLGSVAPADMSLDDASSYDLWVRQYDTIDDGARSAIQARLARLSDQPLVSVLMPVFNAPAPFLIAAIESVMSQLYTNWELCIADDKSSEPHVAQILTRYAERDPRIKVVIRAENGHISAASNSALDLATGTWVAPLDHDDVLTEHALALAVLALAEHPDAGLLYSDEDKIDDAGLRHSPYFKPDFDPLLLLGQNYLTHLSIMRRDLVLAAGGYRQGFEGAQDWDLVLRVSEQLSAEQVVHVPHVLYHWRSHSASTAAVLSAKPYAANAGQRAVVEHLERRGLEGDVSQIALSGHNRVKWRVPDPAPRVSIIIPTKDGRMLQRCVDSVLSFTTYPNFEILIVDNGSRQISTLNYLRGREGQVTVIRDERPFNYSALNNAAVERASGDVLCLLNDDTEVITKDWLEEMIGQLFQPGVGAVGAKLYYPDGRIQHAGVILGIGGVAGHSHRASDRLAAGYFGRLLMAQNLSAVTGACMVVRREAWTEVGGLEEENLAVAFNDVDFGIRLRQAGWRVVWTPEAELFHHESISRGPDTVGERLHDSHKEVAYVEATWSTVLRSDPAYNPNLSLVTEDFSLAWPPRASYRS